MATILETLLATDTLVILTCGECHVKHAIPERLHKKAKTDGRSWYCPNGHFIGYSETENSRLKKEVESTNRRIENMHSVLESKNETIHHLKYSNRALKAAKTKILNRVKNGVCPCCNRTFKNLQDHFKTQHPELLENEG